MLSAVSPMSPLLRTALVLRRAARVVAPLGATVALAGLVVLDAAEPLEPAVAFASAAAIAALLVRAARRKLRTPEGGLAGDVELAWALVVTAYAIAAQHKSGLGGPAGALPFLALALAGAFCRPAASVTACLIAVGIEAGARVLAGAELDAPALALRGGLLAAFAALNAIVLRGELTRMRSRHGALLAEEMERVRADARSYRLLGAGRASTAPPSSPTATPVPEAAPEDERLARSGVEEIHQSVLFALRILRESMGLHTAMLLRQNDAGTHLRISEVASDAPDLADGPFLAGDGIFGAAVTKGGAVSLASLKPGYKLPYYTGAAPVRAVCVLPVHEHGAFRGLLVCDRVEDRPFTPREEALVEEASRYAVRAIHNERVFVQLERAKAEQGKLYRAVESLAAARAEEQVIDSGVKSAREITSVDFAAVTLWDEEGRTHEIRAVSGDATAETETLMGQKFRHNTGLVSMALENRHPLPWRGEYDDRRQVVFTRRVTPPRMPSMIVLPLYAHERPLGTLVLGSRRRGAFHEAARSTLEVLASHLSVSLEGARMVRRLEELATTDGMTGLLNKRAMLDTAVQKIAAAKRFGRQLSVLVTDIDFFKKVNDTYGHDVGDVVIKGLGEILKRAKRTSDAVARFGGEEFVIVCEETDARGAMLLAERVREELGKTTFVAKNSAGETVDLRVTCSIGIATFPAAGADWDTLFKAADTALYASKQGGRNRSTAWSPAAKGTVAA